MKITDFMPRFGLASMIISIGSGLVLLFQYSPVGDVFGRMEEITTLVPYGGVLRQVHYFSAELFVISMTIHAVEHFVKKRYRLYEASEWFRLTSSLCICYFVLFTGFILKGDKEGIYAGYIMLNIMEKIPLLPEAFTGLFIRRGSDFFLLPYIYHCMILPVAVILLLTRHIREWLPNKGIFILSVTLILLLSMVIRPGISIPPDAMVSQVHGPWFFLGIQFLLRYLPPLISAVVIPGIFIGLILILPLVDVNKGGVIYHMVWILFVLYIFLTILGRFLNP